MWWNGIHNGLKIRREKSLRVQIPPSVPYAPLAQVVEQRTFNPRVPGSSPGGRTNLPLWRNGSAVDSYSAGCQFESNQWLHYLHGWPFSQHDGVVSIRCKVQYNIIWATRLW